VLAKKELVLVAIDEVEPNVVYLVLLEHILVLPYLHAVAVTKRLLRQPRQVRSVGQHNAERRLVLALLFRALVLLPGARHTRTHVADVLVA
jgi:hypothetical protein